MKPNLRNLKYLFHQSNLIEGYDDPLFDAQVMVAWRRLEELDIQSLTRGDIVKTQKIVTLRQTDLQPNWRGYFRKIDVYIGGHAALAPDKIEEAMARWLDSYLDMDPIKAHVLFEKIHPFVDGNGRTGRLLLWWTQAKRGEPLTKITYENRRNYYEWFK